MGTGLRGSDSSGSTDAQPSASAAAMKPLTLHRLETCTTLGPGQALVSTSTAGVA
jgi:hypothetical protein